MLRSWKIGTAFGIPIYIHPTFLLAPFLMLSLNHWGGGLAGAVFIVAFILAVFGCVVLHEFGHALMARRFGIKTRSVTIYVIGGIARLESMSEEPFKEFLIAVAGPAVNVVIAVLLTPLVLLAHWTEAAPADALRIVIGLDVWPVLAHFIYLLWAANIGLVLFNLLPAFPMDGGRVLRACLAKWLGFQRGTVIAVRIGTVLAFLLGACGFIATPINWMLPVMALFLATLGQTELLALRYREQRKLAQERLAVAQLVGDPFSPNREPEPVGRAIEVVPLADAQPVHSAEPQLLYRLRAVEIPEPPH